VFQCSRHQIGFRREEVVETALEHAGGFTDLSTDTAP